MQPPLCPFTSVLEQPILATSSLTYTICVTIATSCSLKLCQARTFNVCTREFYLTHTHTHISILNHQLLHRDDLFCSSDTSSVVPGENNVRLCLRGISDALGLHFFSLLQRLSVLSLTQCWNKQQVSDDRSSLDSFRSADS